MLKTINILILISIFLVGCQSTKLPAERYSQYSYQASHTFENNVLKIELKNPLESTLRVFIKISNIELQTRFNTINPVLLKAKTDTLLVFSDVKKEDYSISFSSLLGDTSKSIIMLKMNLPFAKNKEYSIIQGNNSKPTHNTDYSRYAIDFNLKIKDTICSATNGFVFGVSDRYELGGEGDKWKAYGNYITIYDPYSGIFTQYLHLVQNGSLVKIGNKVESGQPIALSGKTGQTNIEHLHFNGSVPVNNNNGLKSIPFQFVEGYKSENLKRNHTVKNN